jgi:dihydrolipoamide dehydrogenase
MKIIDIAVPDLGNFAEVPVIDVLVKAGDVVEAEAPLITLETDKASMDVPAPVAGRLVEILVAKGAKISKGTVIARIESAEVAAVTAPAVPHRRSPLRRPRRRSRPKSRGAPYRAFPSTPMYWFWVRVQEAIRRHFARPTSGSR